MSAKFTPEMKKTHTILVPDMLPVHFQLLINIMAPYGYRCELLRTASRAVVDEGLKNVHNDTCYPALLVIGQFMEALKSGRYNPDTTALLITQTGGGCRASNYIHLLRKALESQFPQVPVISMNVSGLEKDPTCGFQLTAPILLKFLYAVLYGDLLMMIANQCRPYELQKGATEKVLQHWQRKLDQAFKTSEYMHTKKLYRQILDDFAAIPRTKRNKIRVGIVGEIYVKYSPLANNHLEDYLLSEGCEPVIPSLLEFVMYCAVSTAVDGKLYHFFDSSVLKNGLGYELIYKMQKTQIEVVKKHGVFDPPHDFEVLRARADKYINQGVSMGEGWLITAEMAALAESGTENIICTQPFGCLPNHIVAKGMMRVIKDAYPNANIVAIDYDPGATRVNQENRVKLMLANARKPGDL
ncbi:MAG: 2-hydroxyacyl-CoA dehydratase [Oscillospiraceae bacterium]|nr:2-hydroxyacyl-CoA dehydratase [Oscillospiraceae bacterium]